jgi:hypothetical protein
MATKGNCFQFIFWRGPGWGGWKRVCPSL